MNNRKNRTIAIIFLVLEILFIVLPLTYMVAVSFARRTSSYGFEWSFTLQNYRALTKNVYMTAFWNSLELGLISTFFTLLVGYPFGYFMAFLSKKWKNIVMGLLLLQFTIGGLIRLQGWMMILRADGPINRILMAIGLIDEPLQLLYNKAAVVFALSYALLPFMIFSIYSSAEKLDRSLIEASRDLGASRIETFFRVSLPLTLPGLMGGFTLSFIPSMGLFFVSDLLGGGKIPLVGNVIQNEMGRGANWPLAASAAVLLTIMTLVVLLVSMKLGYGREEEAER